MAKSYTQKKYVKPPRKNIPTEVTQAADYIKRWTTRELGKIQHTETSPVCVPIRDGYKIGLYTLTVHPNKTCDVYNPNREFIHRFETKVSAILYTIYTIKKQYWIADDLINLSAEINKNYTDMLSLRRGIEQAITRKDYVAVDIKQNRLEIAEFQLNLARNKISKIHKTGKYNKVWE